MNVINICLLRRLTTALLCLVIVPLSWGQATRGTLALDDARQLVISRDFRLMQFGERSEAFRSEATAAEYLPDPTLFAAIQNLPSDTFALDQEPMTQLRLGVRQMFPKGDALSLRADLSMINAKLETLSAELHGLKLKRSTELAWLDAWFWQKNLSLLEQDEVSLVQIEDFVRSLYEVGSKEQSELLGAQLERVRLQERKIDAKKSYQRHMQALSALIQQSLTGYSLSPQLPELSRFGLSLDEAQLRELIARHPSVGIINHRLKGADKKIDLAKQEFEPAWGLEVSYGMRDGENTNGSERPDFLSAGVSVQLPLFSSQKQKHREEAEQIRSGALEHERDALLNDLFFEYESLRDQIQHTQAQIGLYERELLPALEKQKNSALQSYESGKGDLKLVMELFLKEQRARTMYQKLRVDEQKYLSKLNYLVELSSRPAAKGAPKT